MLSRGIRACLPWAFVVSFCLANGYGSQPATVEMPPANCPGLSSTDEAPAPSIDELLEACQAAKSNFAPVTDADLEATRSHLRQAVARLDNRLKAAGASGDGWRTFLKWDEMGQQLAVSEPDLTALDRIYARHASGHNGLALIWFVDVRQSLRQYLITARIVGNPELKGQYEAILDSLATHLKAYRESPASDGHLTIGRDLALLEDARQAPTLIREVRRHFQRPNLLVQLSANLIGSVAGGPVDEIEPVRDVILGADIRGTSRVTGNVSVELIPHSERVAFDTVLQCTVQSETVGYKGPARVYSDGITKVTARKSLLADSQRTWALPAGSRAVTDTTITGLRMTRGGPALRRLAWKRACNQKAEAERIGARLAEGRISRRIDTRANELVDRLNVAFLEKFRKPLLDRKSFPEIFRFHTTESDVHLVVMHGGPFALGTSVSPPPVSSGHDVVVRLHESMIANLAAASLSGMIVEEETILGELVGLLGSLPAWLQVDEEAEPWGITFTREQPVSAVFADGRFSLTLRGREFTKAQSSYAGMNVTAQYEIRQTDLGFKAVRVGEVQVVPPDLAAGESLSLKEHVARRVLVRKFGRIFKEDFAVDDFVLPDALGQPAELRLSQWESDNGWMVLAWDHVR